MLRLATLGLLQKEPLNGYRLMQQLEFFMGCSISVNSGAIYPLLKRMEEQGEITLLPGEETEAGQSCKIYSITPLGQDHWRQEMMANPKESWINSRSRFLIKFFFFSHLEPAERVLLLEHRLMNCRLRLTQKQAGEVPTDPYRAAVRQRSLEVLESEIQWLTKQLEREQILELGVRSQELEVKRDAGMRRRGDVEKKLTTNN
jgi:DNA-binding PadR family transcriptional regulator